jgi:hypothetical protein
LALIRIRPIAVSGAHDRHAADHEGVEPHAVAWLGWAGNEESRHVQQRSETWTFLRFLESFATHGEGYIEVARDDRPFPMLALFAASGRGVVHQFQSEDQSYLLRRLPSPGLGCC